MRAEEGEDVEEAVAEAVGEDIIAAVLTLEVEAHHHVEVSSDNIWVSVHVYICVLVIMVRIEKCNIEKCNGLWIEILFVTSVYHSSFHGLRL